jgi:PAS domain S-box-containing protein
VPIAGYVLALAAFAAALANLHVAETPAPASTFVLVVIVSAWFCGPRLGMLATALSSVALADYLVTDLSLPADVAVTRFVYFLVIVTFIVWIIGSEREAAASLLRTRDELQRRNAELLEDNRESKAHEEMLRHSESELKLLIDRIPTMAWILGADGKLEFLNRRWLDYTGLSQREAIADELATLHPDDSSGISERWRAALSAGESFESEMRLRRADGVYRWFLVRTVPLLEAGGRVVRWYGTSTDIEDRKRAEQALRLSTARLQHLSRRLLEVHEEERRHFARELHDEFAQLLATIKLHIHAARSAAGPVAQPNLDESIALLQRAGEQVRSLALELRPSMLENAGLDATLRWLAQQHEQRTGVPTEVTGSLGDVDAAFATACFRVVQQALTNVVQHARARHVWIDLIDDQSVLHVSVRDDGAGFDVPAVLQRSAASGHLGLLGMKERMQIVGGSLWVDSQPGKGTLVAVTLPFAHAPTRETAITT